MEEYHFTDGEVGAQSSSDSPNVTKLGKEAKDRWVVCHCCKLILYSGMCSTPESPSIT